MSGRRRRSQKDSDAEDSDDDTEDDGDDESEDDEADDDKEEHVGATSDAIEECLPIEVVVEPAIVNTGISSATKFEPKDILRRINSDDQQQDRDRREKNNKKREVRREADFSSQSYRKNPSFVPLSGNFFLHDDRESGRLVGDEGGQEPSQLTEANLNRQAAEQSQIRTRKERPNQRERDDNRGGGEDMDMWRHDKFEELIATESPRQSMTKGPGQGLGRDGPQYSYGGRGRGRGDGGRGGRGREGRGGRGPYATPSQNVPNPQNVNNNVPHNSQGTAMNIPSSSADSSQDKIGIENINNNHSNTQSSNSSRADVKKYNTNAPAYASAPVNAAVKPQVPSSEATPRVRERGSIMTSGVFAAVQNRQRTAGDRKDDKTRKDSTYDSSLPAHGQSRQQAIPRNGAPKDQDSPANQSNQNQNQIIPQGVHNQINVNQNVTQNANQTQRQKPATDIRQQAPRTSQNKVEKVENRSASTVIVTAVAVDTAAIAEDVMKIELDNKMAMRAMKASAKEFKPTPSSSSPSPTPAPSHTESDEYYNDNCSGFTSGGNQGTSRAQQHSDSPNNGPTHQQQQQQQQQQHGGSQTQNIGVPISHTYPTNVYPNPNAAPRYAHTTVYEMPHQLINAPITYTENTIYTDRPYTETYMDGYMTQGGGGQLMYNIDDRLSGGITGTGTGHRHQVLLTPSMGIDTRTSGDMMTGQIGGTTYYDKGVTYYQDPSTYTDANVQYAPQGLGETFVPYRESRPYGDMHGQAILIGNDGLAVTMAYDDISGGYYPEEAPETNRTELENGSSYYPQQSGALIPYVSYALTPAVPEGPKARPLDLDGKAKPFSPSLVITSTATSTFSGLLASKLSANVNVKKDKISVETECVVDVDMSDAEEVEENDGTEERKGSKDFSVSTSTVASTGGDAL